MCPRSHWTFSTPALLLVLAREGEHLVGHVQPVCEAGRADAFGGEQHVDAATGAEVKDGFALVQFGDGGRVAAAERCERGGVGDLLTVTERVEGGAEDFAAAVEGVAGCAAPRAGVGGRDLERGGRVALTNLLTNVRRCCVGGLAGSAAAAVAVARVAACALSLGSQQLACSLGAQQADGSSRSFRRVGSAQPCG